MFKPAVGFRTFGPSKNDYHRIYPVNKECMPPVNNVKEAGEREKTPTNIKLASYDEKTSIYFTFCIVFAWEYEYDTSLA